jgi:hypothetical protein
MDKQKYKKILTINTFLKNKWTNNGQTLTENGQTNLKKQQTFYIFDKHKKDNCKCIELKNQKCLII